MANSESEIVKDTEQQTQETQNQMNQLFDRVVEKRITMFNRFFPTAMDRAKDRHFEKIIVQEFESRAEKMRIIAEHQKQGLMELLNSDLINLKTVLRSDGIILFTEKFLEVSRHIEKLEAQFIEDWETHETKIHNVKNEKVKAKLIENADNKIDLVLDALFSCLQHFKEIKDELIRSYQR